MAGFDPDAYLKKYAPSAGQQGGGFDPDEYLRKFGKNAAPDNAVVEDVSHEPTLGEKIDAFSDMPIPLPSGGTMRPHQLVEPLVNLPQLESDQAKNIAQSVGEALVPGTRLVDTLTGANLPADIYNATAPDVSGLTSPAMLATIPAAAEIHAAAAAGNVTARLAQLGMAAYFGKEGAQGTFKAANNALKVSRDPNSTLDDQIKAWAAVAPPAAITALAGAGINDAPGTAQALVEAKYGAKNIAAARELGLDGRLSDLAETGRDVVAARQAGFKGKTLGDLIKWQRENTQEANVTDVSPQDKARADVNAQFGQPAPSAVPAGQLALPPPPEPPSNPSITTQIDASLGKGKTPEEVNAIVNANIIAPATQPAPAETPQPAPASPAAPIENPYEKAQYEIQTGTKGYNPYSTEVDTGKPYEIAPGRTVQGQPMSLAEIGGLGAEDFRQLMLDAQSVGRSLTEEAHAHGLSAFGDKKAVAQIQKLRAQAKADYLEALKNAKQATGDLQGELLQDANILASKNQFFSEALAAAKSGNTNSFVDEAGKLITTESNEPVPTSVPVREATPPTQDLGKSNGASEPLPTPVGEVAPAQGVKSAGVPPANPVATAAGPVENFSKALGKPTPIAGASIYKLGNVEVALAPVSDLPNAVEIQSISLKPKSRGKGEGSAALAKLTKLADEHGIILQASVNPFGPAPRMSIEQLQSWYERNGFKDDGYGTIYRQPKKPVVQAPLKLSGPAPLAKQAFSDFLKSVDALRLHGNFYAAGAGSIEAYPFGDGIHLAHIATAPEKRGKGSASKVMQALVDAADAHGVPVNLDIDPTQRGKGALNKAQLAKFYGKFGFERQTYPGTNKLSDHMVRKPQPAKNASQPINAPENAVQIKIPAALPVPAQPEGGQGVRVQDQGLQAPAGAREARASNSPTPSAGEAPPPAQGVAKASGGGAKPPKPPKAPPAPMPEPDPGYLFDPARREAAGGPEVPVGPAYPEPEVPPEALQKALSKPARASVSSMEGADKALKEKTLNELKKAVAKAIGNPNVDQVHQTMIAHVIKDMTDLKELKDHPTTVLQGMLNEVKRLTDAGKAIVKGNKDALNNEVAGLMEQMTEEVGKAKPLNLTPARKNVGIERSILEGAGAKLDSSIDAARKLGLYINTTDVVANALDGYQDFKGFLHRNFLPALDRAHNAQMGMFHELREPLINFLRENKMTEQELERIGAYAHAVQGQASRAEASGVPNEVMFPNKPKVGPPELMKLTDKEKQYYDLARAAFDKIAPRLEQVMLDEFNVKFHFVKDYWPIQRDWTKVLKNSLAEQFGAYKEGKEQLPIKIDRGQEVDQDTLESMSDVLSSIFNGNRTSPARGMTIERLPGAEGPSIVNAADAADLYLKRATQVVTNLHMGRVWSRIINSPEFQKQYGALGKQWAKDLLDTAMRNGNPANTGHIQALDTLKNNLSGAVLALRFLSQVKHITNLVSAVAEVPSGHLIDGIGSAMDPATIKWVEKVAPDVSKRFGGEQALRDLSDLANALAHKVSTKQKLTNLLFAIERKLDYVIAHGTFVGAYKKALEDLGYDQEQFMEMPVVEEARRIAALKTRATVTSLEKIHQAQMLSRHKLTGGNASVTAMTTHFQHTMLRQFSTWQQRLGGEGFGKAADESRTPSERFKAGFNALVTLGVIAAIVSGEIGITEANRWVKRAMTHRQPAHKDNLEEEYIKDALRRIPLIGPMSATAYSGYDGVGIPVIDTLHTAISSIGSLARGKDKYGHNLSPLAKHQAQLDAASTVLALTGVPGVTTFAEYAKSSLPKGMKGLKNLPVLPSPK